MRIERIVGAACLSFLFVAGAGAQGLVPNPGFDRDLSGWTVQQGSAVWSSQDAGGSPASGSLFATPPGAGSAGILSGCFPAAPGAYGANFRFYLPDPGPNPVQMFLRWYSDASCSKLLGNSVSFSGYFHGSTWDTIGTASAGLDAVAPAGTQSAAVQLYAYANAYVDDVTVQRQSVCTPGTCLNGDRFAVSVRWLTAQGSGSGRQVKLTSDSAYYWFFDPSNVELVVKVLDGCAINGHYWVFMGGLTNVRVEITVTDVATGVARTYLNLLGHAFQPVQDTSAFAACP